MAHVSRLLEPAVVERLNQLSLSARRVVEGNTAGLHRSPLKGASIEFRQHRAYAPGDNPRRLDWRVLGRTDRPYIKEYDEETNLRCILMLDRSGSMAYGGRGAAKFDYASRLVASLAYLMLARTETVGLAVYGPKVEHWVPPHAHGAQLSHVIDVLERVAPKGPSKPQRAMRDVADRLGRRALVIVASDFFAPVTEIRQGLARLHHDRHELILLQVLDSDEADFPFRSVSRFRGLEGEKPRLCETSMVRKAYLDNLARHREELEQACGSLGGEFAVFRTDRPMIDELTAFLHKRREVKGRRMKAEGRNRKIRIFVSAFCLLPSSFCLPLTMFLNPLMLAGLGGAVLPVVLHLLNRARYRTVEWGAMMFLPGVEGRQEQSTRLKQILLLLLRMAIVATLAMALARPLVGAGWAAMGADPHCCAVILLDTSASMGYDEGGGTRLEAARRAALAVLGGLERTDEVSLLTLPEGSDTQGAASATVPANDLQTAVARVADLHLSNGRTDVASGLAAAAHLFEQSKAPNHLIVLICDRQAASWKNVTDDFATTWRASVGRKELAPRFVVVSIGGEECENVAVERINVPPPPLVKDIATPIDVVVHNYGHTAVSGLALSLNSSSGHPLLQTTVDIAAGAQTTVTVTPKFSTIGSHVLQAKLATNTRPSPGVSFDDQVDAVVSVVDPLKVLMITGDSTTGGARSQSDYLRLALAPYKTGGEKGPDPADVTLLNAVDPWPADFTGYRVIVLADVPRLDAAQARRVEQFVFEGGGLLIAPGHLMRPLAYNDNLYRGGAGVMPAKLSDATDAPAVDGAPAEMALSAPELTHPVFSFLHERSDLVSDVTVRRYLPAEVRSGEGRVLASYRNNAPAVIEKSFGRGRVLLVTTTLGTEWSTMPRTSFFLPMVQSAVRYLAGGGLDEQNLTPGEPIVARSAEALGDKATMVLPDGTRESVDVLHFGSAQEIRYTDTLHPGRYELNVRTSKGDARIPFIVQSGRDESDLTPLTADRWSQLEHRLGFTRFDGRSADLASATSGRRGGRELWMTLVALVVGLIVAESALSRLWSVEA